MNGDTCLARGCSTTGGDLLIDEVRDNALVVDWVVLVERANVPAGRHNSLLSHM